MEQIIQHLIEFDKAGQEIVRQAQDSRRELLAHMGEYKQALEQEYRERSGNRVEYFRQQAQAEKDEQLSQLKKRYDQQNEQLRLQYQEKSTQWVNEIVARCLNG